MLIVVNVSSKNSPFFRKLKNVLKHIEFEQFKFQLFSHTLLDFKIGKVMFNNNLNGILLAVLL